ncbi:hypothetical protein JHW43_008943 [Diplocarpon mali]|nr:hypothetical protein JHW43_008943 [Diplocarpon mali]
MATSAVGKITYSAWGDPGQEDASSIDWDGNLQVSEICWLRLARLENQTDKICLRACISTLSQPKRAALPCLGQDAAAPIPRVGKGTGVGWPRSEDRGTRPGHGRRARANSGTFARGSLYFLDRDL